jgi:hypothetical protein
VLNITTEPTRPDPEAERAVAKKASLKRYVLEKLRSWVNSLLEAERDEFLGRGSRQLSEWLPAAQDQLFRIG